MNKEKEGCFEPMMNLLNGIGIVVIFFFALYGYYNQVKPTDLGGFFVVIAYTVMTMVLVVPAILAGGLFYILAIVYVGFVIWILSITWEFINPERFISFLFFILIATFEVGIFIGFPIMVMKNSEK